MFTGRTIWRLSPLLELGPVIECMSYCLLHMESLVKCRMYPKSTPASKKAKRLSHRSHAQKAYNWRSRPYMFFLRRQRTELDGLRPRCCCTRPRLSTTTGSSGLATRPRATSFPWGNPSNPHGQLSLTTTTTWLWLKKPVLKWNPGKWKHGPTPA